MGKAAKGSRKGKKAWRANIKTDDIDEYFEKTTKDALSGAASLTSLPSDSLFYVDKSTDIPVKRKIEKKREKVLHYESLLQRNPFVQPVPSSTLKKSKKKRKEILKEKIETQNASKGEDSATTLHDIWNEKGEVHAKVKKKSPTSLIPAVEVEPPGCSFNPPFEAHQDSLARAVADEMQKIYKKELEPQPVPPTVTGEIVAEEDKFFLDADGGNESDVEEGEGDVGDELHAQRKVKLKMVTRAERNRRARHKEQLKAEAEAEKLENLNKEIDSLPDILKDIAKEDEEKHRRHTRRVVAKQERLKAAPPRLGKHKFEPAPLQVLLTEEISGSLRKLKGCCTLARDRFKSLEKRGLVVPRAEGRREK
ncbi:ribosome biogenesis protein NOP53 [Cocos nucifera]|uniref:Ribosome biogenesis protein NOP53 n=1 Tax=Cocos nucifera TaxID=13894 RepID=A0A8K0HUE5_COCNU|nr:ribosome biogenesis protein NOP53 [Cocos nucifera]